jgi:hypothetical protein
MIQTVCVQIHCRKCGAEFKQNFPLSTGDCPTYAAKVKKLKAYAKILNGGGKLPAHQKCPKPDFEIRSIDPV